MSNPQKPEQKPTASWVSAGGPNQGSAQDAQAETPAVVTEPPAAIAAKPIETPKPPPRAPKGESYAETMVRGKRELEKKEREAARKAEVAKNIYTLRCELNHEHDGIFFMDGFQPTVGNVITQDDWYSTYHKAGERFPEMGGSIEAPWCQECWNGGNGRKSGLPLRPVPMVDGQIGFMLTEPRYVKALEREKASERAEALIKRIEEVVRG